MQVYCIFFKESVRISLTRCFCNCVSDKKALFLVNTSDNGPQIYDLVAASLSEKDV